MRNVTSDDDDGRTDQFDQDPDLALELERRGLADLDAQLDDVNEAVQKAFGTNDEEPS